MNKMFKKILAVAAVTATAACLSVSAFAEGETATHTDGSVTVGGYAAVSGATQYTVMVFEDSFTTDNDTDKIYYINQGADPSVLLTGMLVKATTVDGVTSNALPDGDYTVRIGNNATGAAAVDIDLKVVTESGGEEGGETTKTYTFKWGDVNLDGNVDVSDITVLSMRSAGGKTAFGDFVIDTQTGAGFKWGDINLDGNVDVSDITVLSMRSAGGKTTFGDYTIDAEVTISIPVGTEQ